MWKLELREKMLVREKMLESLDNVIKLLADLKRSGICVQISVARETIAMLLGGVCFSMIFYSNIHHFRLGQEERAGNTSTTRQSTTRQSFDDDLSLWSKQSFDDDLSLWSKDLKSHSHGEFSFAVVQGNSVLEDQSQVQTGREATFVGIYDGHGGVNAARYACDHLFNHLLSFALDNKMLSEDIIRNAISETENGFLSLVAKSFDVRPSIAKVGSCCLVGVIWNEKLYIANLGDSRAVLGRLGGSNRIFAEQLTQDHNASIWEVGRELQNLHPNNPLVKGIIQVTRSIGDAYLKRSEFSLGLPHPSCGAKPILRADPAMLVRDIGPNDRFVIFASDGLWENLSNGEAVEMVHDYPRAGIAKRLIVRSLDKAGRVRGTSYEGIKKCKQYERRNYHDDISVVVLFIDHALMDGPQVSIRGFDHAEGPSHFDFTAQF